MMGLERVVDILLNAGANPVLASSEEMNASQIAIKHNFPKIAEKIRTSKNKIKKEGKNNRGLAANYLFFALTNP